MNDINEISFEFMRFNLYLGVFCCINNQLCFEPYILLEIFIPTTLLWKKTPVVLDSKIHFCSSI